MKYFLGFLFAAIVAVRVQIVKDVKTGYTKEMPV